MHAVLHQLSAGLFLVIRTSLSDTPYLDYWTRESALPLLIRQYDKRPHGYVRHLLRPERPGTILGIEDNFLCLGAKASAILVLDSIEMCVGGEIKLLLRMGYTIHRDDGRPARSLLALMVWSDHSPEAGRHRPPDRVI